MLLRHEIEIDCQPADVFDWLGRLDENYLLWHPDHIACNYIKGDGLTAGAIMFCQEYLHGRPHKFRMQLTRVDPDQRVEYSVAPGMSGAFIVEPEGEVVRFIAELWLGFKLSVLSGAQDALLRRLLGWKIGALERHMAEEGANLKSLLEGQGVVVAAELAAAEAAPLELAGRS